MFIEFPDDLKSLKPPKFDYPFYYSPKKLALRAAYELMEELEQGELAHNFEKIGKMFGVLICESQSKIGYLKAFSGVLENGERALDFVPHLYDELPNLAKIKTEINIINELTQKITELNKIDHSCETARFDALIKDKELELSEFKKVLKLKKQKRHELRKLDSTVPESELIKESLADKFHLKEKTKKIQAEIKEIKQQKQSLFAPQEQFLQERKERSINLQHRIFSSYRLLNSVQESKNLLEIFEEFNNAPPPAGAGDCALPKLLQYCYLHNLRPLGFAEFWWGAPHKSRIRKHKNFYHACSGKCKPILTHMLKGIDVEDNPIIQSQSENLSLEIIYQDLDILVVDKPSGLLSVPGVKIEDCVYNRIKTTNPEYTGPIIVHRLDQDTSGIMLLAKNEKAYKDLQQQFIKRVVKKRYTALLDGHIENDKGSINLPIRLDLDNRPMQVVCSQYGKEAYTEFEVIKRFTKNNSKHTLIHFFPHTGRTHQLRVHAAHQDGLNAPIHGDDFYGTKAQRLCLHASKIEFVHPTTKEKMIFEN
ncbi:MAG: RluA family pseudouridine synthase [Flavobacteriaceae bacterium]|nr:RluA family pseudouridine synthase [Flavobacteriaceae bacterium]